MARFASCCVALAGLLAMGFAQRCGAQTAGAETVPDKIVFNRDIRPILSENCFACHGPDKNKRKADLRLDLKDGGAFDKHDDGVPIVVGNPAQSQLVKRITSSDPEELMPPAKSGKSLSPNQIAILKKWIEQGAAWQPHWAFIAPTRPELPATKDGSWARNAIDRFILARLEAEGLHPSPEADRITLVRRLTLDLTGLPPTPSEVDAFVNDHGADAYEKLVDRLLASPHFGERMALDWLDAARYADTHGYHIDSGRDQTRWREWVIESFNRNKPYDQFIVEQLAGDLLPNPTVDQRVATAFVRNNMINFEGGAVPEEYLTAYIIDRVNTTGTVFLGLTVGCCQCHDHKFDPISQKEYYQFYAFFNHVPERGLDGNKGNATPVVPTPTARQQEEIATAQAEVKKLKHQMAVASADIDAAQDAWESSEAARTSDWVPLDLREMKSAGGATFTAQPDRSILVSGSNPPTDTYTLTAPTSLKAITGIRIEALPDDSLPAKGPGRSNNGNIVLTQVKLVAAPTGEPSAAKPLKFKSASADFSQKSFPVAAAIDENPTSGWAIDPQAGKPHAAVFALEEPAQTDGSALLTITVEFQSQFAQHQLGKFRVSVTDAKEPRVDDAVPAPVRSILALALNARTELQKSELRDWYRTHVNPETKKIGEELAKAKQNAVEAEAKARTTMVMEEMPQPRDTFLLLRGQYDKHGEKVSAGVPASLPPIPSGLPNNRLGLAKWLVDPSQPLTSRVTVNRYWQMFFGMGLVKTAEDFGSQGERPSHPELLDWLAVEFTQPSGASGTTVPWDVRSLVRMIVTSSTYRQSSNVSPALLAKDPENRLLARGARMRLPAEFIRDQALAASGLLNDEIGGASVSPYQPPGLWEELMSRSDGANWTAQTYTQSHGKDLYRRTMYTFWKRTSPPPTLTTFDAPDRETCTVRRARTNTPLQALVLMNDPTYVEASRKLAERVMKEAGPSEDDRIRLTFRLATSRLPEPAEVGVLKKIFAGQIEKYRNDSDAAQKLLSVGESKRDATLDSAELAAWSSVASVILNLDETITKS